MSSFKTDLFIAKLLRSEDVGRFKKILRAATFFIKISGGDATAFDMIATEKDEANKIELGIPPKMLTLIKALSSLVFSQSSAKASCNIDLDATQALAKQLKLDPKMINAIMTLVV